MLLTFCSSKPAAGSFPSALPLSSLSPRVEDLQHPYLMSTDLFLAGQVSSSPAGTEGKHLWSCKAKGAAGTLVYLAPLLAELPE